MTDSHRNTPTQVPCALCDDAQRHTVGQAGETIHVFAFRGGSVLESVFQLGVAHAHVAADEKLPTPGLLVGVSAGAVHAASTAEILQAAAQLDEEDRKDPKLRREARLNRFREVLFSYQDFATTFQGSLPDTHEADAGRPLQPNPQAIHFKGEWEARQRALRARSGLIALFNDVFAQTITISALTRLIRALLGRRAVKEAPDAVRASIRRRERWYALRAVLAEGRGFAKLIGSAFHIWVGGSARTLNSLIARWDDTWVRKSAHWLVRHFEGRHANGYTAGQIIFGRRRPRIALNVLRLVVMAAVILVGFWVLYLRLPVVFYVTVLPLLGFLVFLVAYAFTNQPSLWKDLKAVRADLRRFNWKERMLAYYDLEKDLGNDSVIQAFLIKLFDPSYHGRINMVDVARRAVNGDDRAPEPHKAHDLRRRRFESFLRDGQPPLEVVPLVANLATGKILEVPASFRIVDGLRAAVSTVPFLGAVPDEDLEQKQRDLYVDATNVANEPALATIPILAKRLHHDVAKVRLFSVSPMTPRAEEAAPSSGTIDAARRALALGHFRDAGDERQLIDQYNAMLPELRRAPERGPEGVPRALCCFGNDEKGEPKHYVRMEYVRVAPETSLHTTAKFAGENGKAERQVVLATAVAAGCRATLAATFGPAKARAFCRAILDRSDTPGAAEVCAHCVINEPLPLAETATAAAAPLAAPVLPVIQVAEEADELVESVPEVLPDDGPTVNLLFSGGVFRGVFQIGVLNALNELGIEPNVIAGSSVGSVVAAMIAHVFTMPRDPLLLNPKEPSRRLEITRLAATFMTLDKLIITDRFADFVRRLTLRAASAHFSLRDADLFFRNYDRPSNSEEFSRVARRVVGGLEHLFYVSPWELSSLLEAFRLERYADAWELVCRHAQELCDRGLVGQEILGAEPLALLIKQHVLAPEHRDRHSHAITVEYLEKNKLKFLMTATNLSQRKLTIIGMPERGGDVKRAALVDALLASSAFPAVFRPRWSREIFFDDNSTDQYIDGGVLDNLPLGAVVRYLRHRAVEKNEIAPRPARNVPHLLLTASLEPQTDRLDARDIPFVGRSWIKARARAKRLRYNQKIDRFADVQDRLRWLFRTYASAPGLPVGHDQLDLAVVAVKPRWLCGTFAFHPMLGFRRKAQAASIAHGCAATFAAVAEMVNSGSERADWPNAWKMNQASIHNPGKTARLDPDTRTDGKCHFRQTEPCPFYFKENDPLETRIPRDVSQQLSTIYTLCGKPETHRHAPA